MTQDEIIKMAVQAGFCLDINNGIYLSAPIHIVAFANLARAKEREACAKLCEELKPFGFELKLQRATADDCATAIRARGEQE